MASTATRALQTAQLVQSELDDVPLTEDNALYAASLSSLLEQVAELPEEMHCVLLVAHNPGLEELATQLTGDHSVLLKTCSLARVKLEGESWREAVAVQGELVGIQHPREMPD
jgi:phosphohistidine phosphatase